METLLATAVQPLGATGSGELAAPPEAKRVRVSLDRAALTEQARFVPDAKGDLYAHPEDNLSVSVDCSLDGGKSWAFWFGYTTHIGTANGEDGKPLTYSYREDALDIPVKWDTDLNPTAWLRVTHIRASLTTGKDGVQTGLSVDFF